MELAVPGLTSAILRMSVDLGLLRFLIRSDASLTIIKIAELTGASPLLLETGVNEYTVNKVTYILADPKGEAIIYHG
ncbi:uncharacterized protein N7518_002776 [Penicillium psychrosexuale]|uniref:uncharacterized protein n=1 Tax=Penicillium psychrosexuale TaxID=1002107 RepID=UPI0025454D5A|nr:uncharacterized protein N7518_002776 [Penicillium psychrosexuale]KAJ5800708.1 hypothetical protein N7518_002776 [Penicillium psychrosexuale]